MIKPQTKIEGSSQLFETPLLEDTLRQDHPLIILSKAINWDDLIDKISAFYSEKEGRPTLPIRLMIGLLLIKYLFNMSDAEVVANWEENIYHQAFTGQGTFVKGPPCHPSQLTLFRQRIKEKGCEIILAESVRLHGTMALEKTCIIDTTVQEKNITYPTDSKLLLKAIAFILKIGLFLAIPFTRNYKKEVKTLKKDINFSKGKLEPQKKEEKVSRLRTIANALFKDFLCKIPKKLLKLYPIAHSLMVLKKVINQKKDDKDKIYSINEPQTQCIIKGKTDKKYEFGSKVSFVLSKCTGIILGALNFKNNIYDGDTIEPAINQLSRLHNGYKPETMVGDCGYRGRPTVKGVKIITPYDNVKGLIFKVARKIKNFLKRRTIIEPIIGHLKNDHRLSRNFLKGTLGDMMNPLLAAAAFNMLKYARIEYSHLHRPPKTLAIRVRLQRSKFTGLPIWRQQNSLF